VNNTEGFTLASWRLFIFCQGHTQCLTLGIMLAEPTCQEILEQYWITPPKVHEIQEQYSIISSTGHEIQEYWIIPFTQHIPGFQSRYGHEVPSSLTLLPMYWPHGYLAHKRAILLSHGTYIPQTSPIRPRNALNQYCSRFKRTANCESHNGGEYQGSLRAQLNWTWAAAYTVTT
jgi:hypothetical protein